MKTLVASAEPPRRPRRTTATATTLSWPGANLVLNTTGMAEAVLTSGQADAILLRLLPE